MSERPDFLPDEAPIFDSIDDLAEALWQGDNDNLDPDRPFTGQPWTDDGERGKQPLSGIRMRDVADCLALAFLYSCRGFSGLAESGQATWNDVYEAVAADPEFSPRAVAQNLTCELERRMGIFPNIAGKDGSE